MAKSNKSTIWILGTVAVVCTAAIVYSNMAPRHDKHPMPMAPVEHREPAPKQPAQNPGISQADMDNMIENYLMNHPTILKDMEAKAQEQAQAEKARVLREYLAEHSNEMMEHAPVMGKQDAQKTIFVWTDFSCPFCRRVHGEFDRVLKERDDTRVVIKNFSIHGALSDAPAKAVIAAKMQDPEKSAKLVEYMMTNDYYTSEDTADNAKVDENITNSVMRIASEQGLDVERLKNDMNSETVNNELNQVRELANRFEIRGTPFLIIGDTAFPGAIPYDQIKGALDK